MPSERCLTPVNHLSFVTYVVNGLNTYEIHVLICRFYISRRSTMLQQARCDVVTFMLKRQLQWGLTLLVLGIYNRTILEQQARTLDRPLTRRKFTFFPPGGMMERSSIDIVPCIRVCTMVQQELHNVNVIALESRSCRYMQR